MMNGGVPMFDVLDTRLLNEAETVDHLLLYLPWVSFIFIGKAFIHSISTTAIDVTGDNLLSLIPSSRFTTGRHCIRTRFYSLTQQT
jgi:hypothetical protein